MSKLISANLSRLFHSIWFWACGLVMLLYSLWQAVELLSWAANGPWKGQAMDYVTCRVGDFTVPMLIVLPVLAILLSAGLLWLPQYLFEQLSYARQTVSMEYVQTVIDPDGSVTYVRNGEEIAYEDLDWVLSPRYVPEPRRSVYRFLMEALPGGQAFWLSDSIDMEGGALNMSACSLALAALATGLGLILFRRRDLK